LEKLLFSVDFKRFSLDVFLILMFVAEVAQKVIPGPAVQPDTQQNVLGLKFFNSNFPR
jgi:hypothetical protein